jgi:hypothetical protein
MSDKVKVFFCTLCERTWDQVPEGAVKLAGSRRRGGKGHTATYRFTDGSIHILKKKAQSAEVTK